MLNVVCLRLICPLNLNSKMNNRLATAALNRAENANFFDCFFVYFEERSVSISTSLNELPPK